MRVLMLAMVTFWVIPPATMGRMAVSGGVVTSSVRFEIFTPAIEIYLL
jgi:hypothetical protein